MAKDYFIGGPNARRGPHDLDELRDMVAARRLRHDDLVAPPGADDWVAAHAVPGLTDLFESIPRDSPGPEDDDRPARRRDDQWSSDWHRGDLGSFAEHRRKHRDLIERFRREIHSLGGLWIFMGCLGFALGAFLFSQSSDPALSNVGVIAGLVCLMSLLWFLGGIFACLKKMPAVYLGLALCYLSLTGNVIANVMRFDVRSVITFVILFFAIAQGHRVISFARKMQAADIPLDAQP